MSTGPVNKALHPNGDKLWSEEEVDELVKEIRRWKASGELEMFGNFNKLYAKVGQELGRSKSAVQSKHVSLRRQGRIRI